MEMIRPDRWCIAIAIILLAAAVSMIPLRMNEVEQFYGYTGEHIFASEEYGDFKQAVVEYARRDVSQSFAMIEVYDAHEPIIVSYFRLSVKQGFPYGEAKYLRHDGTPFTWAKPTLFIVGFFMLIWGLAGNMARKM